MKCKHYYLTNTIVKINRAGRREDEVGFKNRRTIYKIIAQRAQDVCMTGYFTHDTSAARRGVKEAGIAVCI